MAVEIEAKMRVEDLQAIRDRLSAAGAQPRGQVMETNIFFDTEDRSLLAADQGLRVRVNADADSGDQRVMVTYKGPRQHGVLKSRDEIELTVDDAEAAGRLFEHLGFGRTLTFAKRRESWSLDGCSVELDELPYLGTFVEIEGTTEADVLRVKQALGLGDAAPIKASYIALLMTYLQEHGLPSRNVRFE